MKKTNANNKTPNRASWDLAVMSVVFALLGWQVIPALIPDAMALGLGPRVLPVATSYTISLLSLIGFLLSVKGIGRDAKLITSQTRPVLILLLVTTIGVVISSIAGLSVGTFFIILTLTYLLNERRVLVCLSLALVSALIVYAAVPQ